METRDIRDQQDWSTLDDHILIKAHLRGEATAFEVLFKKYRQMVSRLVYSVLKEESAVEDVVQEVFILIHRNLIKFRQDSALKTWIYRITVNEAVRHLNRRKRWQYMDEGQLENTVNTSTMVYLGPGESPERVLFESEQSQLVHRALDALKPNHRVILTLYYLEDLSVQEIASVLDIPEGSVKSRLYYARDGLKKVLDPILSGISHSDRGQHAIL